MQVFGALPTSSDVCDVSDFCDLALSQEGVDITHTITYTTNGTALKNKRKSNDAIHFVTGVHYMTYIPDKFKLLKIFLFKNIMELNEILIRCFYRRIFHIRIKNIHKKRDYIRMLNLIRVK